ncbi:oligosaccharide flippase family protein [Solibacillus ferritrahens]|uniref:oligosaccharide flippase family protein n=1 Tax=Solibacillus ferritrahens TaxID=3098620 RepID=UPI00300A88A8
MNQIRMGAILSYISIFLTFAVGLIYTPILIRLLGQTDYGLYSLILAIASYLSLLDLGVGNAIVRYIARNRSIGDSKKESDLIGQFLIFFSIIGFLTMVLGMIIYMMVPDIFKNSIDTSDINTAQIMVLVLSLNFALSFPLNVYSAVLQAYEKFIFLRLSSIVRILLVPILTLFTLQVGGHLITMTVITSLVNISILVIGYIYAKRYIGIRVTFSPIEKNFKKEIFSYAFLIFLTSIADKIYWQTDQVLLGIMENSNIVAIYAVAIQFIMIFMSLSTAISSLFLPKISQIVTEKNHTTQVNDLFLKISRVQFFIIALAFSGFILFGREFIILWAGKSFETAYAIVVILMIPFFFDLIQNTGIVILQARGLYMFRTISLLACSLLNIIVSIPVINYYGSIGTAIVTAFFVALGNVLLLNFYYHIKIGLNMKLYWLSITKSLIPIIVLIFITYIIRFKFEFATSLIVAISTYLVFYTLIVYIFCLNLHERNSLRNIKIRLKESKWRKRY